MQNALKNFHYYDLTVESYFYLKKENVLYDMIILLHELDLPICGPRQALIPI